MIDYEYELETLRRLSVEANSLSQVLPMFHKPLKQTLSSQTPNTYHKRLQQQQQMPQTATTPTTSPWLSPNVPSPTPAPRQVEHNSFTLLRREFEAKFYKVLKKVYHTLEQNELRLALQEERTRIMWEWKQLAIIIDRLLLWLFIIATGLTTFLILFEPILFQEKLPPYS